MVLVGLPLLVLVAGSLLFARAMMLRDSVLPSVSVAGVELGGLSRADAQARLQAELGARLAEPVTVEVGTKSLVVQPDELFRLDVAETEERAFRAGRDSISARLAALVEPLALTREVQPVLEVQPGERRTLLGDLRALTRRPADARLRMEGKEVVLARARFGTSVAASSLLPALEAAALGRSDRVVAELGSMRPHVTTPEALATQAQAETIVSAPVPIRFKAKQVGELAPGTLAGLVRFVAAHGAIRVTLAREELAARLLPMIKAKTTKPVDARFEVVGSRVR